MRKLFQWFFDLPLNTKLFWCLMLFLILPLLLVSIFINMRVTDVLNRNVRETYMQVLKQTEPTLEGLVRDLEFVSLTLLSNDEMQELIRYHLDQTSIDLEERAYKLVANIQPMMSSRPYINSICISHDDDVIFQYGDRVTKEDLTYSTLAAALNGKPLWTPAYQLPNRIVQKPAERIISLVRTVNDLYAMRSLGTERISVPESVFFDLYAHIHKEESGRILMLDADGNILSAKEKSSIGETPGDFIALQKLQAASEGYYQTVVNNQPITVFHYQVARTGWFVVQWLPDHVISRQTRLINFVILASIALCVLFGILFSIVLNRSINRPILRIAHEMDKVQSGNFDITLATENRDEIGNLGRRFKEMVSRITTLINSVYVSKLREREAELIAMEAQINPHFLYNTLDSIRWMAVKNRDYAVGEQIEALSDLFRHALNKGREMTTILEEVEHLKNYILIQKSRYGDRIAFELDIEPSCLSVGCPKLIFQPLAENAILHGLEKKVGGGTVVIHVSKTVDDLKIVVKDDGLGTDQTIVQQKINSSDEEHNAFALKNIHDRILFNYGEPYGLTFESQLGVGTTATILIPVANKEARDEIIDRG